MGVLITISQLYILCELLRERERERERERGEGEGLFLLLNIK